MAVASALLVAGCGGGGPAAPADATHADFCAAWDRLALVEDGAGVRAFGAGLRRVGTPADAPGDARDGFEVLVAAAARAGADDDVEDLTAGTARAADVRDLASFFAWARAECGPPEVVLTRSPSP